MECFRESVGSSSQNCCDIFLSELQLVKTEITQRKRKLRLKNITANLYEDGITKFYTDLAYKINTFLVRYRLVQESQRH